MTRRRPLKATRPLPRPLDSLYPAARAADDRHSKLNAKLASWASGEAPYADVVPAIVEFGLAVRTLLQTIKASEHLDHMTDETPLPEVFSAAAKALAITKPVTRKRPASLAKAKRKSK